MFTLLKVPLMLVPSVVTIPMQATRIRASMTAYSTAVGPSSLVRKREIKETEERGHGCSSPPQLIDAFPDVIRFLLKVRLLSQPVRQGSFSFSVQFFFVNINDRFRPRLG